MAQYTTVEDQVIDMLHRAHACDLEEVTRQCTNLTWEPSVSRRRPLEPKRRDRAHAQGPGHLYIDLPAPAGRSA